MMNKRKPKQTKETERHDSCTSYSQKLTVRMIHRMIGAITCLCEKNDEMKVTNRKKSQQTKKIRWNKQIIKNRLFEGQQHQ